MADLPGQGPVLALFIFGFGVGSVVLVTIVIERLWLQLMLTALFVVSGASLFKPGDATKAIYDQVGGTSGLWLTAAAIGFGVLVLARMIFMLLPPLRDWPRKRLVPGLWDVPAAGAVSFDDQLKRWFVTIAAATGNMLGIFLTEPEVLKTVYAALALQRLFATVLLTVVSIFLLSPGEDFFLSAGSSGGEPGKSHFEELFHNMSWRTAGRIAMVLGIWMALNVVHKCVDESINSTDIKTSLIILLSVAPSGLITYYWCAALQRGVRNVSTRAFAAVVPAALFLLIPVALSIVVISLPHDVYANIPGVEARHGFTVAALGATFWTIVYVCGALLFAGYLSFAQYGLAAGWGGLMLDSNPANLRRPAFLTIALTMAVVGCAQVLTYTLLLGLLHLMAGLNMPDKDFLHSFFFLVGTLCWGLGLLFAHFPQIVRRAHARAAAG